MDLDKGWYAIKTQTTKKLNHKKLDWLRIIGERERESAKKKRNEESKEEKRRVSIEFILGK